MEQTRLVENHIEDGKKLVERLVLERLGVTAAFWAKSSEDCQWYLYLVVRGVERKGAGKAYERVNAVWRAMSQPFWVDRFGVKVIGPTDALAQGVLDFQRRYPTKKGTHYPGDRLGGVEVEGAYLYPALVTAASA